jgi:hypothetical protein
LPLRRIGKNPGPDRSPIHLSIFSKNRVPPPTPQFLHHLLIPINLMNQKIRIDDQTSPLPKHRGNSALPAPNPPRNPDYWLAFKQVFLPTRNLYIGQIAM